MDALSLAKGFPPSAFVLATLGNPREKFWGRLVDLDPRGIVLCGVLLDSFDDFVRQLRGGEAAVPVIIFYPMHRVQSVELERSDGPVPSLLERFRQETGADPGEVFPAPNGRGAAVKSQFWTAPNQITLLRLIFVPFVVINILDHNFKSALVLFVLAGLSDALDGLLARWLNQQSILGQYLDPIADKLLLSSAFLVLSFTKQIPWKYTVLVFSRDLSIMLITAVLYITTSIRDFRPSVFGKMNTAAQIGADFFCAALAHRSRTLDRHRAPGFSGGHLILTCLSALHYILLTGQKLHASGEDGPTARSSRLRVLESHQPLVS